jgi:RNA polymerase sigma-70 factor (ECF subfamily)
MSKQILDANIRRQTGCESANGGNSGCEIGILSEQVPEPDNVNKPDHELIADCLQGQTHVFGELVVRYQNRLYNSLAHMLGSVDDARDVTQEAFIHAFVKLHTFRGHSAFYSWLFRIALNSAASHRRKGQRLAVSLDASRDQTGFEPADAHPESPPGSHLETTERQQLVQRALEQLTPEYRTVLVLKEMEGFSYEEIAAVVECPIGTVRSRIHRARIELKSRLEPLFREPAGPTRAADQDLGVV